MHLENAVPMCAITCHVFEAFAFRLPRTQALTVNAKALDFTANAVKKRVQRYSCVDRCSPTNALSSEGAGAWCIYYLSSVTPARDIAAHNFTISTGAHC